MITASNKVREAARYILEEKKERPGADLHTLIDEAGMRFNLTPIESDSLARILAEEEGKAAD